MTWFLSCKFSYDVDIYESLLKYLQLTYIWENNRFGKNRKLLMVLYSSYLLIVFSKWWLAKYIQDLFKSPTLMDFHWLYTNTFNCLTSPKTNFIAIGLFSLGLPHIFANRFLNRFLFVYIEACVFRDIFTIFIFFYGTMVRL